MSTNDVRINSAPESMRVAKVDMKLEVGRHPRLGCRSRKEI
jgi:hypothetical protein